jgi:hypothetical protein
VIPFSAPEFLDVFASYDLAVFPMQIVMPIAAHSTLYKRFCPSQRDDDLGYQMTLANKRP